MDGQKRSSRQERYSACSGCDDRYDIRFYFPWVQKCSRKQYGFHNHDEPQAIGWTFGAKKVLTCGCSFNSGIGELPCLGYHRAGPKKQCRSKHAKLEE